MSHQESVLDSLKNLNMVLLKFRTPPLNFIQEAPNLMNYIYLHADSALVFADIVRNCTTDWRFDYLDAVLYHKFVEATPLSINNSRAFETPLASVLLPVMHDSQNPLSRQLRVYIPTAKPMSLVIDISNRRALLKELEEKMIEKIEFRHEKLWLRKRDDISKLMHSLEGKLDITELKSYIANKSGGYRAIEFTLKIPIVFLSTEFVFFASIKNVDALRQELNTLIKTGFGKKRDMGFGDLLSWEVYELSTNSRNITILDPMILAIGAKNYTKLITLRNTPVSLLEDLHNNGMLPLRLRIASSSTKPPYWVKKEFCITPFSEMLIKKA
ncbi:hypothetical protein [Thermosphaera sp.]